MFENLLNIAMGDIATYQEGTVSQSLNEEHSNEEDLELKVLEEHFGTLKNGKVISLSLRELLRLLPRKRQRSDAYKGLITKLNQRGVKLNIISHKISSKNDSKIESNSNSKN